MLRVRHDSAVAEAAAAVVLIGRLDSTAAAVRLLDDEGDTIRLSKPLLLPSAAARLRRMSGSTAATAAAAARKARLNKHCCELGDAAVAAYTLQACDAEAALAWQGTSPLPLLLLQAGAATPRAHPAQGGWEARRRVEDVHRRCTRMGDATVIASCAASAARMPRRRGRPTRHSTRTHRREGGGLRSQAAPSRAKVCGSPPRARKAGRSRGEERSVGEVCADGAALAVVVLLVPGRRRRPPSRPGHGPLPLR